MRRFYSILITLPLVCDPGVVTQRPVLPVAKTGELVVLTRNSAATRYIDSQGRYAGLEYDLVETFAREQGYRVRYLDRQPFYQLLPALERNHAHLAAAGVAITARRLDHYAFAPSYQLVQSVVAYNTDNEAPRDLRDVEGKRLEVVKGSSAVDELQRLRKRNPKLNWTEVAENDSEGLLARLSEGRVDYVITDSHLLDVARHLYPNIARGFALGDREALAWAFPKNVDPDLYRRAQEFFMRITYDGTLRQMLERYYGHINRLDNLDIANFLERRQAVLPRYRASFKEAQEVTGIDWRMLAALGFQESHWDPLATSPTGVRGLMMLTSETADRMQLTDRLDAHQSILAGAEYLQELRESLPARITEPDRTWFALAAYNIGLGHLEDARILTQRHGGNPNLWVDAKKYLPLLSRYEYYSTLRHGFCRGGEALVLTENIRNYYDILARTEEPHEPSFGMLLAGDDDSDPRVSGKPRTARVRDAAKQTTTQVR
jgi:membrane-bound lytic murein transglycosylase F